MNRAKEVRWMYVILFLSFFILLTTLGYTFRIFNETTHNFEQIEKSDTLINRTSNFESYLFLNESKVRLAVIKNNTDELGLDSAYTNTQARLERIRILIKDTLDFERMDSIKQLIDYRFALWGRIVEMIHDTTSGEYLAGSLTAQGAYVTNYIADIMTKVRLNEMVFLNRSRENAKYGIETISILLIGATVFSLIFIFFTFRRLHSEIKKEMEVHIKLHSKIHELDRSNADLERFAYTASHDLQEPLRKLHAFSEKLVLQEKDSLSNEGKEIVDKMQKFVGRMQRLIEDLLLFSRTISHKLTKTEVDLNKVLNDVKQNISEYILNTGTIINATDLPHIMGYESQLQQLFQNLISNSIRYARRETPPLISITASVVSDNKVIGVREIDRNKKFNLLIFSDNGIGFDNKYAEKIFEIFQRLHGKSEYEGTGIGLAICKVVVEKHVGYIRASATEGEGANFMIYFPII